MSRPDSHVEIEIKSCSNSKNERPNEHGNAPEIDQQELKGDEMSSSHANNTDRYHENSKNTLHMRERKFSNENEEEGNPYRDEPINKNCVTFSDSLSCIK